MFSSFRMSGRGCLSLSRPRKDEQYIFCKDANLTITPFLQLSTLATVQARDVATMAEVEESLDAEDYLRQSFDLPSQRLLRLGG